MMIIVMTSCQTIDDDGCFSENEKRKREQSQESQHQVRERKLIYHLHDSLKRYSPTTTATTREENTKQQQLIQLQNQRNKKRLFGT